MTTPTQCIYTVVSGEKMSNGLWRNVVLAYKSEMSKAHDVLEHLLVNRFAMHPWIDEMSDKSITIHKNEVDSDEIDTNPNIVLGYSWLNDGKSWEQFI